MQTHTENRRK